MTSLSQIIRVGLLASEPEMIEWFCEDIGCVSDDEGGQMMTFSNRQLSFEDAHPASGAPSKKFEVIVGIVCFVDVLTLQKMDQYLSEYQAGKSTPCLMLIYRNENETEFKMSCPFCGQKLWVRDADQDKRGRCPHCSKGFTLPDQQEHIVTALRLPATVGVKKIVRQDPGSFAAPLRDMLHLSTVEASLANLDMDKPFLSNDTMKVNVVEEPAD